MGHLFDQLARAAACDDPVLLHGPPGPAELLAASVHDGSARRAGPFIVADCAALRPGSLAGDLIPAAAGGTLLLAEVAELPAGLQREAVALLARGRAEVRVMSTTRHDLAARVTDRRFAEDLYYRLAAIKVIVPTVAPPRSPGQYAAARRAAIERFEREYCFGILDVAGGVVTAAARRAGMSRQLLHRLLRRHRLDGA